MAALTTFEVQHGDDDIYLFAREHPSSARDITGPSGKTAVGPAVQARVNHGRWIADCPQIGCHGAEFVSFDVPVFFCCECRNAGSNHDLLPVLLPAPKDRERIERLLTARPVPLNRNWQPGETAAALAAENAEHGVAV